MMNGHAELDSDLYRTALDQLDRVAKRLDLDPDVHERCDTRGVRWSCRFRCAEMTAEPRCSWAIECIPVRCWVPPRGAPCEILIPAAVGSQIRSDNADGISARLVVEAANEPTTPEADVILAERGVTVVPDILANSGGVVVSYFEWVQRLQQYFWRETEITSRLQEIMTRAFNRVWSVASKEELDLRRCMT